MLQLKPFGPREMYTYFNSQTQGKRIFDKKTAYDRLHDKSPYDFRKARCDRKKQSTIWEGIHEQNKYHKVGITTSLWYGRPNRIQVDFPESKFRRSRFIQDSFYSRNNLNLRPDLE